MIAPPLFRAFDAPCGALRLRLHRWGSGPRKALFLHGMAGNGYWWSLAAPHLAGLDAAALDFRGHGESDWAPDGAYRVESFVDDIEAARAALGWDTFVLVGHSLGARAALHYATVHAERLEKLVALDFLPTYKVRTARFERSRRLFQPTYAAPEPMLERFHLEPDGTLLDPETLRDLAWTCIKREGARWTWRFDWRAFTMTYWASWPDLSGTKVPALVVRGANSVVMSGPDLDRVVASIPGAEGVEIPKAHHHVPLDAPAETAAAVLGFIGLESGPRAR